MSQPELSYPMGESLPPAQGFIEVVPGVRWIRFQLPFALDHINLWLLAEGEGWVLVDTGLGDERSRGHWDGLFQSALEGRPIHRIIVTHYHPDHMGNAEWLSRVFGAPVAMTTGEFLTAHAVHSGSALFNPDAVAGLFHAHGLVGEMLSDTAGRGDMYPRMVPALPLTYQRLAAGDRITVGGSDWQVLLGLGHAPEHACLYCAERGVLISGDQVLPRISTNVAVTAAEPEGDPLALFLDTLTRFARLPGDTLVLPSHGRPFTGLRVRLADLRRHHAERLDAVMAACDDPVTAAEMLPVLFQRPLDTHQRFFAMGEAIAHLNHLWHGNRLARVTDDNGVHRFHNRPV